jgi:hypothetical protein
MRKSKFSESQIVEMLKDAESGVAVADLLRNHGRGSQLDLFEEEVAREDIKVVRGFQWARWLDGKLLPWSGRRKSNRPLRGLAGRYGDHPELARAFTLASPDETARVDPVVTNTFTDPEPKDVGNEKRRTGYLFVALGLQTCHLSGF